MQSNYKNSLNMPELVSVVIAVYNGEQYLAAAIESVLAQDYRTIEIIVVDDGSTDATAEIARSFRQVRCEQIPHAGIGGALNHGIQSASGDFLSFLDADDLWTEHKLTEQMQLLETEPSLDAVFGYFQEFRDDTPDMLSPPQEALSKGTMLIRSHSFWRVGLFDPQWQVGDFIAWFIRATEMQLKYAMPQQVYLKRRIHGANMGTRERDRRTAYLHILKQALDRRERGDS